MVDRTGEWWSWKNVETIGRTGDFLAMISMAASDMFAI